MSSDKRYTLPNDIVFDHALQLLQQGQTVTLPIAGRSMEPTLAEGDRIVLAPIHQSPRRGDIVLYRSGSRWMLHRLLRRKGDSALLRGDACPTKERVAFDSLFGVVTHIVHPDGRQLRTHSLRGWLSGRRAMAVNSLRLLLQRYFNRRVRDRLRPLYFVALLLLMWLPMGGVPLDNFVFGIRFDHICHASVYIPCSWFLFRFGKLHGWQPWLLTLCVGALTEGVQYLLPYRGFDINDLAANFLGGTLGWLLLLVVLRRLTPRKSASDASQHSE